MRPVITSCAYLAPDLLAACGEVDSTPKPLTEKQSQLLDKELAGKVAGKPVNCISDFNGTNISGSATNPALPRVGQSGVQKQAALQLPRPRARQRYHRVPNNSAARNAGATVATGRPTSGMPGPVCSLGEFVPYRKDKKAGQSQLIAQEYRFNRHLEQIGDAKRERQRRVIFSRLDGIDRLPRYGERIGQILLAPVAFGAQDFQAVFHSRSRVQSGSCYSARQPQAPCRSRSGIAARGEDIVNL